MNNDINDFQLFDNLYEGNEDKLPEHLESILDDCYKVWDDLKFYQEEDCCEFLFKLQKDLKAYIKIGVIAHTVKIKKLYKAYTKTFTEFCEKFLGYQYRQVNRLICSSHLAIRLMKLGFKTLPKNESQCRYLERLDDYHLNKVWTHIINTIPEHLLTAKAIAEIVDKYLISLVDNGYNTEINEYYAEKEVKPIQIVAKRIKRQVWLKLEDLANRLGMTAKDYLEVLVNNASQYLEVNP